MSTLKFVRFFLVSLIVLTMVSVSVQAFATLSVTPSRVSPNTMVTITLTSIGDTQIDRIEVSGPDGTLYVKDMLDVQLEDGEVLTENFGTGVAGWTPAADTSQEGWYHVAVIAFEPPYRTEDYFDVSRMFFVPEFAIAPVVITAIGFAILTLVQRANKK